MRIVPPPDRRGAWRRRWSVGSASTPVPRPALAHDRRRLRSDAGVTMHPCGRRERVRDLERGKAFQLEATDATDEPAGRALLRGPQAVAAPLVARCTPGR